MTRTSGPLGWLVAATLLASSACPTLAPAQTAPTQTVSFIARRDFEAGTYPHSVAVADFNGDGKLDIASVSTQTTYVLLGNGDGTFGAAQNVGPGGYSVAVGDFNSDGFPAWPSSAATTPASMSCSTPQTGAGAGTTKNSVHRLKHVLQKKLPWACSHCPSSYYSPSLRNGPGLLSFLAYRMFGSTVKSVNDFPRGMAGQRGVAVLRPAMFSRLD